MIESVTIQNIQRLLYVFQSVLLVSESFVDALVDGMSKEMLFQGGQDTVSLFSLFCLSSMMYRTQVMKNATVLQNVNVTQILLLD